MKYSSIVAILLVSFLTCAFHSAVSAADTKKAESRKPIIGINCDIDGDKPRLIRLSAAYVQALKNAGAIPVLLPPMPEDDLICMLKSLDGIMMIGGDDYPPSLYGQKTEAKTEVMDEERWRFDILLAKSVLEKTKLPFLGICAGCQALNIARGGSLIQDIPTKLPEMKVSHASKDGWQKGFNRHDVRFAKLTKLKSIYDGIDSLKVPTSHHQCVDKTGEELTVAATADDGMVEAIELKGDRFVVGVQWHPERDFPANKQLFKNFIDAAQSHGAEKSGSSTASLQRRFSAE